MRSLAFSVRGKVVNNLRRDGVEAGELSPAPQSSSPALWEKTSIYTSGLRRFSAPVSTANNSFLPLLFDYFSPLSTGPINTTTKYINKIVRICTIRALAGASWPSSQTALRVQSLKMNGVSTS